MTIEFPEHFGHNSCRLLSSTDTESLPENFCMIESQQSVRVSWPAYAVPLRCPLTYRPAVQLATSSHGCAFTSVLCMPFNSNIPGSAPLLEDYIQHMMQMLQDFAKLQLEEISDNISARRNKIFLLMEEVRRLRIQQRIKGGEKTREEEVGTYWPRPLLAAQKRQSVVDFPGTAGPEISPRTCLCTVAHSSAQAYQTLGDHMAVV